MYVTNHHEELLFKRFIVSPKRNRYQQLLSSEHGRQKLIKYLDHFKDLDERFIEPVPASLHHPKLLLDVLKGKRAPLQSHVTSSNPRIDGQDLPLIVALERTIGNGYGTFLSCIPGELAYYESEEPNFRYILERHDL
jgi:hypothetical protein